MSRLKITSIEVIGEDGKDVFCTFNDGSTAVLGVDEYIVKKVHS